MAVKLKATEFGGTTQRNGIAPPTTPRGQKGHTVLSAAELLHLGYVTGQETDTTRVPQPNGESFEGLDSLEEAKARMPKTVTWMDANG